MDTRLANDQKEGIVSRIFQLREKETLFLKDQGINEAILKEQLSLEKTLEDLENAKERRNDLILKKKGLLAESAKKICDKLDEILPFKQAYFNCDDDFKLGIKNKGKITLYNGLSGSQKATFDAALENLLGANMIMVEGAEIDEKNMQRILDELVESPKQVIINTCHDVATIPAKFHKIILGAS